MLEYMSAREAVSNLQILKSQDTLRNKMVKRYKIKSKKSLDKIVLPTSPLLWDHFISYVCYMRVLATNVFYEWLVEYG